MYSIIRSTGCCAGGINSLDLRDNLCIWLDFFSQCAQFRIEILILLRKILEKF